MQRDDSLLLDMLQAARQIREYTSGVQELGIKTVAGTVSCFKEVSR